MNQQSRLSILHLMVGTACIGLYMALSRTVWVTPALGIQGGDAAIWTVWGIGSGAALGGFVLLIARRLRRQRFPVYPGETIFAVLGLEAAIEILFYGLTAISLAITAQEPYFPIQASQPCIQSLIIAGLFAAASFRVTPRRWRVFFLCASGSYLAYFPLISLGPAGYFIAPFIADIVLTVVVIMDHRDGHRYPWTHWMGVILDLWSIPLIGLWLAVYAQMLREGF